MSVSGERTLEPLRGVALMRAQARILAALMLRDIRTRFFGSAWGFLIVIAWPLALDRKSCSSTSCSDGRRPTATAWRCGSPPASFRSSAFPTCRE